MREQAASYNTFFVAQFGLLWVVIVVSLGARTVEGEPAAGQASSSSSGSCSRTGSRRSRTTRSGRPCSLSPPSSCSRFVRGHFGVSATIATLRRRVVALAFYLVGRTGLDDRFGADRARGRGLGLGAIAYTRTPRGRPRAQQAQVARAHAGVARQAEGSPQRHGRGSTRRRMSRHHAARRSEHRNDPARHAARLTMKFAGITALDKVSLDVGERRTHSRSSKTAAGEDDVLQLPARHPARPTKARSHSKART